MIILNNIIKFSELKSLENSSYFDYMIKGVVDIEQGIIALNAELHSDLEEYLIANGSDNKNIYGFNIYLDDFEIDYDSLINPPRNREDGYPRGGRIIASEAKRELIRRLILKWIEI